MSVRVMTAVWDCGPNNYIDRYVLLCIADNASDDGNSYPSIAKIINKTKLGKRTVTRSIQNLESDGWLITNRRSRKVRFSTYDIQLSRFSEPSAAQALGNMDGRSASHDTSEVPISHRRSAYQSQVPHTPYIEEPSMNHQKQPPAKTVCEIFGERCFKAYPKKTSPKASVIAFSVLIKELRDSKHSPTLTAAGNWLLQRVQLYAASPCVTTRPLRYIPKASAWVSEGKYDEEPSLWSIAAPPPTQNVDFQTERAQLARIM